MASVTRAEIAALIEDEYSDALIDRSMETSTVLRAFRTVRMGSKTQNLPAIATRPEAKWVGESAGERTKPSSVFSFENKMLTAAEVATIIVLNEEDIEDANEELLTTAARLGGEALGAALDEAVLFGVNKPAAWTSNDLFAAATAAGATFQVGDGPNDLVGSIFQAAGAVDSSGANPDAIIARNGLKYKLANLRDGQGAPIYLPSLSSAAGAVDNVGGLDAYWNGNGAWDNSKALAMVADPNLAIIGIRKDISVKFLEEATVNGVNLAENDQVGLRFRARYAYVLADVKGRDGENVAPVAAVIPGAEEPAA